MSALERALDALVAGDGAALERATRRVSALDRSGLWAGAVPLLEEALAALVEGREPQQRTLEALLEALGAGPIAATFAERLRRRPG